MLICLREKQPFIQNELICDKLLVKVLIPGSERRLLFLVLMQTNIIKPGTATPLFPTPPFSE